MRVSRGGGVFVEEAMMNRTKEEIRLLIGMAGVTLVTLAILLTELSRLAPAAPW